MYNINLFSQDVTINTSDKTITVRTAADKTFAFKLSFNNSYVLKLNKTTVSTCDVDMLYYLLTHDDDMFCAFLIQIVNASRPYTGKAVSISAFIDRFEPLELVDYFNKATHATRQKIIRYLCCDNHTGKMSGMISFSTLVTLNRFCLARMNLKKAVCVHCFAARQLGIYADQLKKLAKAHAIATMCAWSIDDIPVIEKKFKYFRLESFGDINNVLQVRNYNILASALERQNIPVTLWTKNPGIILQAINDGMTLSDNLVIGLSSLELNTPEIEKAKKYSFIKFLFTVYTQEYATAHNIRINCGGRHCLSCLNCYKHVRNCDGLMIINELLK